MSLGVAMRRRIGLLMSLTEDNSGAKAHLAAFHQGLEKRGWSEGRNVQIESRFAGGDVNKFGPLAKAARPFST